MKILVQSVIIIILLFLFIKCSIEEEMFLLKGTVKGIKDNTTIFLIDSNNNPIDSTQINNEEFTFSGSVENDEQFFIFLKSTMDFEAIWIENSLILFKAETEKFDEAKITGSKTQQFQDILNSKMAALNKELEAINNIYHERFYMYP